MYSLFKIKNNISASSRLQIKTVLPDSRESAIICIESMCKQLYEGYFYKILLC